MQRGAFREMCSEVRLARHFVTDAGPQLWILRKLTNLNGVDFAAVCGAVEPGPYRARPMAVELLKQVGPHHAPSQDAVRGFLRGAEWRKRVREKHPFFPGTRYHLWRFG